MFFSRRAIVLLSIILFAVNIRSQKVSNFSIKPSIAVVIPTQEFTGFDFCPTYAFSVDYNLKQNFSIGFVLGGFYVFKQEVYYWEKENDRIDNFHNHKFAIDLRYKFFDEKKLSPFMFFQPAFNISELEYAIKTEKDYMRKYETSFNPGFYFGGGLEIYSSDKLDLTFETGYRYIFINTENHTVLTMDTFTGIQAEFGLKFNLMKRE